VTTLTKRGRKPEIRVISPQELLVGKQIYAAAQTYPQWHTIPVDLVLLGDLSTNLLMYDQALGELYPPDVYGLTPGISAVKLTYSPFVGSYHCLNLFGRSAAELTKAVQALR
jgi:hypothetical protein